MTEQLANAAQSTLASGISAGALSLTVADPSSFPTSGDFRLIIDSEYLLVTAVSGSTFTVARGVESSTAATHASGATVTHELTVGGLTAFVTENAGGGAVDSVNGHTGVVVLSASDVGADAAGAAAAEATARASAVTAEATARASADTSEATARASADTTLQANITAEATARANADALKADLVAGVVPTSQIPAAAMVKPTVVASQAAQLALVAQEGDVAIRSDQHKTYMHNSGTAGDMTDWTLLDSPADAVTSVNGQTGTVVLGYADVGAASTSDSRLSDTRTPTDGSVTAAKVNAALKPSGTAAAGTEALRALGTSASTAAAGNDSRLSDARTPSAHASSHASGGSDAITVAESQVTNLTTDLAAKAMALTPTPIKTANYTSVVGDLARFDTTSGALVNTLPTAPADKSVLGAKIVTLGTGNGVTVTCGGSDVINKPGGGTTTTLSVIGHTAILIYHASDSAWVVWANDVPLSQLDLRYQGIAAAAGGDLTGTYPNPTIKSSVALGGSPTTTTQAAGDNSTKLATTAYSDTATGLLVPKSLVDAKGDLIVGTADNTVARKAVGSNGKVLGADSAQTDGLTWLTPGNYYRTLLRVGGRATTAAASGTKYMPISGAVEQTGSNPSGANASQVQMLQLTAADLSASGLTTKLRVEGIIQTAVTAPAITITLGFYPLTAGANTTLGTVVAGSTVVFTTPASNSLVFGAGSDFDMPADGVYALGFIVSGTPAAAFAVQAALQVRHV